MVNKDVYIDVTVWLRGAGPGMESQAIRSPWPGRHRCATALPCCIPASKSVLFPEAEWTAVLLPTPDHIMRNRVCVCVCVCVLRLQYTPVTRTTQEVVGPIASMTRKTRLLWWLQLRFDFDSTDVRRAFDNLSKIITALMMCNVHNGKSTQNVLTLSTFQYLILLHTKIEYIILNIFEFRIACAFGLLCSIGCLLVKLHILVKFLLYKLCYHLDGE